MSVTNANLHADCLSALFYLVIYLFLRNAVICLWGRNQWEGNKDGILLPIQEKNKNTEIKKRMREAFQQMYNCWWFFHSGVCQMSVCVGRMYVPLDPELLLSSGSVFSLCCLSLPSSSSLLVWNKSHTISSVPWQPKIWNPVALTIWLWAAKVWGFFQLKSLLSRVFQITAPCLIDKINLL